jgi:hypothetical protein
MSTIRQGHILLSPHHETICLTYEEALKRGYEADYGNHPDGGYWVEVYGCTLTFSPTSSKPPEEQRNAMASAGR